MMATFAFPTSIYFGAGQVAGLSDLLNQIGAKAPLIVTDSGLVATPVFKRVVATVSPGVSVFPEIESNPSGESVEKGTRAFLDNRCDAVIGLGGGSAIDVAKVIRLRAALPNWNLEQPPPTDRTLDNLAPFVAIPTTAGTGSEVGRSSVITIAGQKRVIFHPQLLARAVVLDPELTVDMPPKLTAATGADALTHCIESFTSPTFHPLCDGIALEGIHLIAQALPRVMKQPRDLEARGHMLVAATMGGIAFQKDLGAAHSLAHPLSAISHLHHGLANALVLTTVMRFNAARKPGLYKRVGLAMGLPAATDEQTIAAVESLFADIGIPRGLAARGVTDAQLQPLTDQAFADGCHQTNPVPVTRNDLYRLYQEAM